MKGKNFIMYKQMKLNVCVTYYICIHSSFEGYLGLTNNVAIMNTAANKHECTGISVIS